MAAPPGQFIALWGIMHSKRNFCDPLLKLDRTATYSHILLIKIKSFLELLANKSFIHILYWSIRFKETSGGSRISQDANSKGGCEKLLFSRFLTKNCVKLKEFGLRGGHVPGASLRSANGDHWQIQEGNYGGPHLCQISFIFLPNILPNNRFSPPTQGLVPVLEILDPPLETCNLLWWIFAKHTFLISWSYLE